MEEIEQKFKIVVNPLSPNLGLASKRASCEDSHLDFSFKPLYEYFRLYILFLILNFKSIFFKESLIII